MRVYTTSRLNELAGRAPTDAQLHTLGRVARGARQYHVASLIRYCRRRAAFYSRVQQQQLANAYAEFASQLLVLCD